MHGMCELKIEPDCEGVVLPPAAARRNRLSIRLSTRADERFMNVRVDDEGVHAHLPFRNQLVPCFIPAAAIRECKAGSISMTLALENSAAEDAQDDYEDGGWGIVDDFDDAVVDEDGATAPTQDEDKQATFMLLMEANDRVDVVVDPLREGVRVAQLKKMSDLVAIPLRLIGGRQIGWAVCREGIKLESHYAGRPCRGIIEWNAIVRFESGDEVREWPEEEASGGGTTPLPAPLKFPVRSMVAGYNPSRLTPND